MAGVIEASEDGAFDMASIAVPEELKKLCSTCSTSQPRSAFSGKQWKAKAAQRRCTQCIDNEAADAYAAADPAVIRAKNEYLRALEELVAVEAARPELREFARVTSEMIVQMTRAALEWEERNPFEYDDGSPDPLLRALRELRAAPEKLRVDPKTLARCRLRRRDEEAVVIEAGFVGGGRTDRADLEPAQTIVLSRFGLEEVDHDSAGPPQAWKGRMILDHGYARPDADLVALLRVTSARREVVTIFLDGDISVPPPPGRRGPEYEFYAEWDPHDPETSVGVDAVNEMMAAGMLVMSCVGEIVKRCGLDSTPEGRRLAALPPAQKNADIRICLGGIEYAKLWGAHGGSLQVARIMLSKCGDLPDAAPVRPDARTRAAKGLPVVTGEG